MRYKEYRDIYITFLMDFIRKNVLGDKFTDLEYDIFLNEVANLNNVKGEDIINIAKTILQKTSRVTAYDIPYLAERINKECCRTHYKLTK